MKHTAWVIVLWLATSMVAVMAEEIDESAAVDPRGEIDISNTSGNIEISGWDRNEVRVTGELGKGSERLEFVPEGKHTLIKVVLPNRGRDVEGSDLVIKVPEASRINVTTVSADVDVADVRGSQRLQTVSGDIESEIFEDDLEARSVSGDLVIVGHEQSAVVTLTTVSGDAVVTDIAGEIVASSVSGDLEIRGKELLRTRMRTTNGDLELYASLADDGRVDVETINGDVEIILSGKVESEYEVETFNGDIRNCFGAESRRTSKYAPGNELRYAKNDETQGHVRVKTLNGNVEVCHR